MVISDERRAALGAATIAELRAALQGEVITPDDARYDSARRVFNAMIDRYPALITRVASANDVVRVIEFARSTGLPLAVRSGGHNVAGHGTCDGGIVLDLGALKIVEVDAERRVARVGAGLRLGELIPALEAEGFVTPTGTVSDTGIGGLTLGGGYGWLSGVYGMAVDNVLGAEIVTADGQVLEIDDTRHPDLFWAIRGGSGNFGVVTRFDLRIYPAPQLTGGMLVHPFERAREVLRAYREWTLAAPDEVTTYAALVTMPDGQQVVVIILCYAGAPERAEEVLAPIRGFGPPLADTIAPLRYSAMNTLLDDANPPGLHNYWKWNGLRELSDEAIDRIVEAAARVPSPLTAIVIDQVNGAARRVASDAVAFAHRDAPHGLVIISMWQDPADSERNIAWTRELAAATAPFATGGVYVNGMPADDDRARAAYGSNYERLVAVKNRYDPANLFRLNTNIRPTVTA